MANNPVRALVCRGFVDHWRKNSRSDLRYEIRSSGAQVYVTGFAPHRREARLETARLALGLPGWSKVFEGPLPEFLAWTGMVRRAT